MFIYIHILSYYMFVKTRMHIYKSAIYFSNGKQFCRKILLQLVLPRSLHTVFHLTSLQWYCCNTYYKAIHLVPNIHCSMTIHSYQHHNNICVISRHGCRNLCKWAGGSHLVDKKSKVHIISKVACCVAKPPISKLRLTCSNHTCIATMYVKESCHLETINFGSFHFIERNIALEKHQCQHYI